MNLLTGLKHVRLSETFKIRYSNRYNRPSSGSLLVCVRVCAGLRSIRRADRSRCSRLDVGAFVFLFGDLYYVATKDSLYYYVDRPPKLILSIIYARVCMFFTLTDRVSTIPSTKRGCQSGMWPAGQEKIRVTSTSSNKSIKTKARQKRQKQRRKITNKKQMP